MKDAYNVIPLDGDDSLKGKEKHIIYVAVIIIDMRNPIKTELNGFFKL